MRAIAQVEGVAALYKGLVPTLLKVAPASGITFAVYEWCKSELMARRDDPPAVIDVFEKKVHY